MSHLKTNPSGRSFLSYRRSRKDEAELLIQAQQILGIPTWRDIDDLDEGPTEDGLRDALRNPNTANALLWISGDVADSAMIVRREAREIISRVRQDPSFFVVPVAADGLDYPDAASAVDSGLTLDTLENWNIRKVNGNPVDYAEAAQVARWVLQRRLRAIHERLGVGKPLVLQLHTRRKPAFDSSVHLSLDWTSSFQEREALSGHWDARLLSGLRSLAEVIRKVCPGRSLLASGFCSIPAATALGHAFMDPGGIPLAWNQLGRDTGEYEQWHGGVPQEDSGFITEERAKNAASNDLALFVSVNAGVEAAVARSDSPSFRAVIEVRHKTEPSARLETPGQALHVARLVRDAARSAKVEYPDTTRIHLFMAVPIGLAALIGQLLNTLGPVQTYEHIQTDTVGKYRTAALLREL